MKFLSIAFISCLFACSENKSIQLNYDTDSNQYNFSIASPAEFGLDTSILNDLTQKIYEQYYPNIHSLLIIKDGSLLYEKYFPGKDENYGEDIGVVMHSDSTLHDLRSISKSIVSACIGIAIDHGFIKSIEQKISDFFPEIKFEGEKKNWTIEHFLTMTTGLEWNENYDYDNPDNDEIRMASDKNPIKFVLKKPLETSPGIKFNYNGGATQILAEIIERASKTSIDLFANAYLFMPLGIEKFEWNKFSKWNGADKFAAPSGLRLTSLDLMKIGLLYRNKGKWKDVQVLTQEWIVKSFTPQIEFPSNVAMGNDSYGYQFWIWNDFLLGKEISIVNANGNGGQNIYWDLENDIIIITTAGNYNNRDIENDTYAVLRNHIYPAIGKIK